MLSSRDCDFGDRNSTGDLNDRGDTSNNLRKLGRHHSFFSVPSSRFCRFSRVSPNHLARQSMVLRSEAPIPFFFSVKTIRLQYVLMNALSCWSRGRGFSPTTRFIVRRQSLNRFFSVPPISRF